MKLSGEKNSYAWIPQDQLCEARKRKKINRKHKLNEGVQAAFERCKRKCECICRPLKKGFKLLKSRGRKIDYTL